MNDRGPMMNDIEGSLILRTVARFLVPLLLLFSVFLLLRGHNEPGGGFIAGLVASMAFAFLMLALDVGKAAWALRVDPRSLLGVGLLVAALSALPSMFLGQAPFTSQWWSPVLPVVGEIKLSTPLIFDIGVYLTVIGAVMTIVLTLAAAEHEADKREFLDKLERSGEEED